MNSMQLWKSWTKIPQMAQRAVYDSVIADAGCRLVSAASCVYVDHGSHLLGNINTYVEIKICSPRYSLEYLQTVSLLYLLYNFNRWEDLWMLTC
jgi:hypothetical protein